MSTSVVYILCLLQLSLSLNILCIIKLSLIVLTLVISRQQSRECEFQELNFLFAVVMGSTPESCKERIVFIPPFVSLWNRTSNTNPPFQHQYTYSPPCNISCQRSEHKHRRIESQNGLRWKGSQRPSSSSPPPHAGPPTRGASFYICNGAFGVTSIGSCLGSWGSISNVKASLLLIAFGKLFSAFQCSL